MMSRFTVSMSSVEKRDSSPRARGSGTKCGSVLVPSDESDAAMKKY
jgi:hypothetical protein